MPSEQTLLPFYGLTVTGVLGVAHLAGSTYIAAFCWTLLIPLFVWTPQNSPVSSQQQDLNPLPRQTQHQQAQIIKLQRELAQSKHDMLQMAQRFKADQDLLLVKIAEFERMLRPQS